MEDWWTEEKCLLLIREYRRQPSLWDQRSANYFHKLKKPEAWAEIGKALNIAPEKCKHKMSVLLSSFRREKAKFVNIIRSGTGFTIPYQSTWFAFHDMTFLLDKDAERKLKLMESEDNEDNEGPSTTSDPNPVDLMRYLVRPVENKGHNTKSKKPKILVQNDKVIEVRPAEPEEKQLLAPSPLQNEDEINFFSNFIASKMRKYSETTKNAVQQAICEIIFKADQHFYELQPKEECARSSRPSTPELQPSSSDVAIKFYCSDSE